MAIEIKEKEIPAVIVPMEREEAIAITLDDQSYYNEMNKNHNDGVSSFMLAIAIFFIALFARGIAKLFLYIGLFGLIWYVVSIL